MPATALTSAEQASASDRARMAPIAAAMYAAAGLVVAVSLLFPHPEGMNGTGLLVAAAIGPLTAATIWLLRRRLPDWFFHISTAAGSLLTGLCVLWGGDSGSPYAWLLLWVAVFSAYFFTPLETALHLLFAGIVYAAVLDIHPEPDGAMALNWVMTMVAIALGAAMILALVRSRRQLEIDRERLLSETIELARTDPLTGLLNRRAWHDLLEREVARSRRYGDPLCVAMLDLDHFKRFNDENGHISGDELLCEIAEAWSDTIRPSDVLARYGGEEFALLLPNCSLELAIEVVERLRTRIPRGERCSAGIGCWDGIEPPIDLIARADARLYDAKRLGRDRSIALT